MHAKQIQRNRRCKGYSSRVLGHGGTRATSPARIIEFDWHKDDLLPASTPAQRRLEALVARHGNKVFSADKLERDAIQAIEAEQERLALDEPPIDEAYADAMAAEEIER